jgi:hypothetical protein
MPVGAASPDMQQLVLKHFSVAAESLGHGLLQLKDSFLVQSNVSGKLSWSFKHPTIVDAISATLGETEGMTELYLRGTGSEVIVAEAVCSGAPPIPDAVVIPETLDDLLVERLAELPDEPWINRSLFGFLYQRASDQCFKKFVLAHEQMLARNVYFSERLLYDPTILMQARAHNLGLLQSQLRSETADALVDSLFKYADTSFLKEDSILALLRPTKLLHLYSELRDYLVVSLPSMADEVAKDPSLDLDEDPEYHFESILTVFKELESYFDGDPSAVTVLSDAKDGIDYAIRGVEKKKREKERKTTEQEEEDNWHWEERAPADSASAEIKSVSRGPRGVRSIFSDVDQ